MFLAALALSVSAKSATFQGLGLGPEANSIQSNAAHLSADGSTVTGGYSVTNGGSHAYRWNACTGMGRIQPASQGTQLSNAYDVSGNGTVITGAELADAFRWTEAGGMMPLGLVNAVGTTVSDDGTLILGYGRLNGPYSPIQAWSKTGSGPVTPFDFPDYLAISGISRDNTIVVGGGGPAYRWTASTGAVQLPDLDPVNNPDSSGAWDISADGLVIVGTSIASDGTTHLVKWTGANNAITDLGMIGTSAGSVYATNADGSFIVGMAQRTVNGGSSAYAFIWDATNGVRDLQQVLTNTYGLGTQLTGWQLTDATGISDDGNVIVGDGNSPNSGTGYTEAWRATLYSTSTITCGTSTASINGTTQPVTLPLTGAPGVESRSSDGTGNGNHTFCFGFTSPISSVDSVSATCGSVASSGVDPANANFYLVQLNAAACNQQYLTVTLSGVHDSAQTLASKQGPGSKHTGGSKITTAPSQSAASASITAGILIGDTNGDGVVNSADVSQTKSRSGQPVDATNFRSDVNADGTINSADISLVKSKSGTALPPAP